jgi:hypothetical protein
MRLRNLEAFEAVYCKIQFKHKTAEKNWNDKVLSENLFLLVAVKRELPIRGPL